ncbi:MAG: NAD-dependent epimerase/dehydratase family protein [Candidatus Sericytochromatia bacterium]
MKNIIICKNSNLSKHLFDKLHSADLISSRDILKKDNLLSIYKNEYLNIIINGFQPANCLNDISDPLDYISNSILVTSKILSEIKNLNINKIIYTSSSSVYGDNPYCKEEDLLSPLNLHSSLKVANEKLIEKYCTENNIKYHIIRIFNMYGGDDNFSVISKIIKAYKQKEVLKIVNNGSAIRDFIHINDVTSVYKYILENNINYPILNIGSGKGISLSILLEFLELNNVKIQIENITRNEIKISTACVEKINSFINTHNFSDVKDYLILELKSLSYN